MRLFLSSPLSVRAVLGILGFSRVFLFVGRGRRYHTGRGRLRRFLVLNAMCCAPAAIDFLVVLGIRVGKFAVSLAKLQLQFLVLHLAFQLLHSPKVFLAPLMAVPRSLTPERLVTSDAFPLFVLGAFSTRPFQVCRGI